MKFLTAKKQSRSIHKKVLIPPESKRPARVANQAEISGGVTFLSKEEAKRIVIDHVRRSNRKRLLLQLQLTGREYRRLVSKAWQMYLS